MEQPLTQYWQSEDGYYTVLLTPDLFGAWVLVTSSGKREGRGGRVNRKPIASYGQGLEEIRKIRQRKCREGYVLCSSGFVQFDDLDPARPETVSAEAQAILRVFEHWALSQAECAAMLDQSGRPVNVCLQDRGLAGDSELHQRCTHLLAIHKALRTLHAGSHDKARDWLRQPNTRFDQSRPIDVMMGSLEGLKLIRRDLECAADVQAGRGACPCPDQAPAKSP